MPEAQTTVYIVDDDSAVRESLASLLELEGYKVMPFATARAFLSQVDGQTAGVLLLDVRLPDMNGLDVQARLVEWGTKLAVIVITGHSDVAMAVRAIKAGAANFVEKPFFGDVIIDSVCAAEMHSCGPAGDDKKRQEIQARLNLLSQCEMDVLRKLVAGSQNKVIAFELEVGLRDVEVHRARVMEKMQASSLSDLVRMTLSVGLDSDTL